MATGSTGSGRVVVVHPDRRGQRGLHRVLGATLRSVTTVDSLAAAAADLAARGPAVVVVDQVSAAGDPAAALALGVDWIAVPVDPAVPADPGLVVELLAAGCRHVLTNPMPLFAEELIATAQKLLRGDVFGLEKYVAWGAEIRGLAIVEAAARADVVADLVRDVVEAGLPERVASLASVIADELVTNALITAPTRAGTTPAAAVGTTRGVATLRWASDARYLVIEVADRWGALDPGVPGPLLASASRHRPPVDSGGMGLPLVYACCHQLVLAVAPGQRTEAMALLDVRFRPAELGRASSFHVFVGGPS